MIVNGPSHQLLKARVAHLIRDRPGTGTWRGILQKQGSPGCWTAETNPYKPSGWLSWGRKFKIHTVRVDNNRVPTYLHAVWILAFEAQGNVDVCVVRNHVMHHLAQLLANIRYQVIDRVLQKAFLDEYTLHQADEPWSLGDKVPRATNQESRDVNYSTISRPWDNVIFKSIELLWKYHVRICIKYLLAMHGNHGEKIDQRIMTRDPW